MFRETEFSKRSQVMLKQLQYLCFKINLLLFDFYGPCFLGRCNTLLYYSFRSTFREWQSRLKPM